MSAIDRTNDCIPLPPTMPDLPMFPEAVYPELAEAIRSWGENSSLRGLYASLVGHSRRSLFLDACAEAVVAHHLQSRGCELQFEVPTPTGRTVDFEVTRGDEHLYVHVKHLDTARPIRRRLSISSRLRYLERIERPLVVRVRWHEGTTDRQMQRLVRTAAEFIRHSQVGDELVVRDEDDTEIGGVLIVAPWAGPNVSLAIGLPDGFIDEAPRLRKLMRRAYKQFMPRARNLVVIVTSERNDEDDVLSALLGAHVQRWDTYPPRGRRVAYGRAEDGFWTGQHYADSSLLLWFPLHVDRPGLEGRLWSRGAPLEDAEGTALVESLFDVSVTSP